MPEPPGHQSFRATAPLLYPKALGRLAPEEAAPPGQSQLRVWLELGLGLPLSLCEALAAGGLLAVRGTPGGGLAILLGASGGTRWQARPLSGVLQAAGFWESVVSSAPCSEGRDHGHLTPFHGWLYVA